MPTDLSAVRNTPPPLPHKTEVIPVHTSDRGTFKFCRRKWDYTSPMRQNLRPKVTVNGISMPLWFGTGIHYCLERYYNPSLRLDPVASWLEWYNLQWNGGLVVQSELKDLSWDGAPRRHAEVWQNEQVWQIRGLSELLPDPDPDEFEQHRILGEEMMKFYRDYADRHDNFAVIQAEHEFSVPIPAPLMMQGNTVWEYAGTMYAMDERDGEGKPVHYRGKMDAIIQDMETGAYGILENKTAVSIDEEYFLKLEKDEQCNSYMWAAEQEAALHDLEYKQIDFVLYNALRKTYPKPPTQLKNGTFSMDRQKESTTPELLLRFIEEHNLDLIVQNNEKMQAYIQYVIDAGEEQFIKRDIVRRNRHEIRSTGERIFMEVLDMLDKPSIYPNPTGNWLCLRCPFRAPCIGQDDGSDFQTLIDNNYEKNPGR